MTAPIHLALIGHGKLGLALRTHGAPLGRIRLVQDRHKAQATLIELPQPERVPAVITALQAGHIVLCPPPVALDAAELAAIEQAQNAGGGRLLPAGEIAHTPAGRRGLAEMAAPAFGPLRSLYIAIRQPRGPGPDVLDSLLPEALDMVLAAIPDTFTSARINAASLFGPERDTAIILLRTDSDIVVTLELSRCLPPTLPAPGLGEIEIDAMGAHQAIRIAASAGAVSVYRDDGTTTHPWLDSPALAMLRALEHAHGTPQTAPSGLTRAFRALAVDGLIRGK